MKNYLSKKNIIILGVIVIAIALFGYYIFKIQSNKYTNFVDPKLTNGELATIESKISDLENKIKTEQNTGDQNNPDKKADLFKFHMELSSYYRLRGRLLDAQNEVYKAMDLQPDNISPYGELYVIQLARGDYLGAEEGLKKGLQINPNNGQYWRWLLDLHQNYIKDNPQELEKLYKDAIQKSSNNVDVIVYYAGYLESKGDLVGAVAQWRKAIELNPANTNLYQTEISRIQNKLK